MVRDLAFSKEATEILNCGFSNHHTIDSEAKITLYLTDEEFVHYYSEYINFVFCNNILALLLVMGCLSTTLLNGVYLLTVLNEV